ncbi:MAG: PqqD family protein [Candidatus Aminicenantales bacterium]
MKSVKEEIDKGVNLLELIPVRNIKWKKRENGLIVLLKPKFSHPLLQQYLLPRMKRPYFTIRLDEVGSFVWEQCDGRLTVREVGERLREKFGERIEPLYDRLAFFLQSMEKNKFITYRQVTGSPVE